MEQVRKDELVEEIKRLDSPEYLTLRADEALKDWTDVEVVWLSKVPQELQPTARRYRKVCFSLVMQHGAMNHGISICMQGRPPRDAQIALGIVVNSYNNLMALALKGAGLTEELFLSCKEDVERVAALMDTGKGLPGEKKAGQGIIIAS